MAAGTPELWSGTLLNAIAFDQYGPPVLGIPAVWTGTAVDGTGVPGHELGSLTPEVGQRLSADGFWIAGADGVQTIQFPLYAISGPLVVPTSAVPEPSTVSLLVGPAFLLLAGRKFLLSARLERKEVHDQQRQRHHRDP